MTSFSDCLRDYTVFFNQQLPAFFPLPSGPEKRVVEAMLYSVSNGGKRLRPFLVAETAALFGITREQSLPVAVALECLHSYSLIHDDLPAMDNDTLRRGKPTCHIQFDEATAILAGDGLLTYAFEILNRSQTVTDAVKRSELSLLLAKSAGAFDGMIAGQMLDLFSEQNQIPADQAETVIKHIEEMKTGRLLSYACEAGAVLGNADSETRQKLIDYSRKIGIAFQIADDILDVEGNPELVGKTLNKDAAQGKLTFISIYSLESARQIGNRLINEAKNIVASLNADTAKLQLLADFIMNRSS